MSAAETKTITEYFDENPNVDNTEIFNEFWRILTDLRKKLEKRFSVERHSTSDGYEYYQTPDQSYEGSLNTFEGDIVEWMVHSWIGNRKASILDMNFTVWLGPQIDVPHLGIVFGTIPKIYHYSDCLPRRDLMTNHDYLQKYYEPFNQEFLKLRGDKRFETMVSHGSYMRAILTPIAANCATDRDMLMIPVLEEYVHKLFDYWIGMVEKASVLPEAEQRIIQKRDHYLRQACYQFDPMNGLSRRFLGDELTDTLVNARMGREQIRKKGGELL
jgi:hypothetical protein